MGVEPMGLSCFPPGILESTRHISGKRQDSLREANTADIKKY